MKTKILLLVFIASLAVTSCDTEPYGDDIEKGSILLVGSTPNLLTAKTPPLCSDLEPYLVEFVLMHEDGTMEGVQSLVTIIDNEIIQENPPELPIGRYTVINVSLISQTGVVTHSIPENEPNAGLNWGAFVNNPLPFEIEILPDQTTIINGELICYSSQILDLNGFVNGLKITDLKTLYWEIPRMGSWPNDSACVDQAVIVQDGKTVYDFEVGGRGIRGTPILKEFQQLTMTVYSNGVVVDQVVYTNSNYNPDNQISYADVVQFSCN